MTGIPYLPAECHLVSNIFISHLFYLLFTGQWLVALTLSHLNLTVGCHKTTGHFRIGESNLDSTWLSWCPNQSSRNPLYHKKFSVWAWHHLLASTCLYPADMKKKILPGTWTLISIWIYISLQSKLGFKFPSTIFCQLSIIYPCFNPAKQKWQRVIS